MFKLQLSQCGANIIRKNNDLNNINSTLLNKFPNVCIMRTAMATTTSLVPNIYIP